MTPIFNAEVLFIVWIVLVFWKPVIWQAFLDSLASKGGHLFILILLIAWGSRMFVVDQHLGDKIIDLTFGALIGILSVKLGQPSDDTASTKGDVNGSVNAH